MNFKRLFFLTFFSITIIFASGLNAQDTTLTIGSKLAKQKVNYYDFSDPLKVNFEVIAWGGFKYPGKYLVPEGTTMMDLMTFAGLPLNSDLLENVRLLRTKDITAKYQSATVVKYNFKKFFQKETTDFSAENPLVKPGDILLIPLEPEKTFWDYLKEAFVLVGPIASILSLIITINNSKN
ncbi:MAG: hypothetical protein K1X86_11830 [Ignavibacteria bacterium]|nr:hypothetical protein [Ignavibacteria bacterium]